MNQRINPLELLPEGFEVEGAAPDPMSLLPDGFEVLPPQTVGGNLREIPKALPEGIATLGALPMKAGATAQAAGQHSAAEFGRRQLEVMDRIDAGETVPEMDDAIGYQHMDAEQRAAARAEVEQAQQAFAPTPIAEKPLYRAGEAVQEAGREMFPAEPGYEDSWGRNLGAGLGTVAAAIAASFAAGPAGAAAVFTATGAGEAVDNAIAAGASEDEIIQAAKAGTIPGLTDSLPIEVLLGRVPIPGIGRLNLPPGAIGRGLQAIGRIGAQAFIEGVQEGGQEFLQNLISREIHSPDQELVEGVPEGAGLGAAVGGVVESMAQPFRRRGATPDARQPVAPQLEQQPQGQQAAPPPPPPGFEIIPPDVPADAVPADALYPSPEDQQLAVQAGYSPEQIADMAPEELAQAAQEARDAGLQSQAPQEARQPERPSQPAPAPGTAPLAPRDRPDAPAPGTAPIAPRPEREAAAVPEGFEIIGTRKAPVTVETAEDVAAAGQAANPEPSEAQAKAGNYAKGHLRLHGLDISIENPKGSVRRGKNRHGVEWETTLPAAYGYFKGTKARDGDQVDVFIGEQPESDRAFVIDQIEPSTGRFDEPKVFMGVGSSREAMELYEASFSDGSGPARVGALTETSIDDLKAWLDSGRKGPFAGKRLAPKPAAKPKETPVAEEVQADTRDRRDEGQAALRRPGETAQDTGRAAPAETEQKPETEVGLSLTEVGQRKEAPVAEAVPTDEGEVQAGRPAGEEGGAEGGANLQRDEPGKAGDAQPQRAEEVQPVAAPSPEAKGLDVTPETTARFNLYLGSTKPLAPKAIAKSLKITELQARHLIAQELRKPDSRIRYSKKGDFQRKPRFKGPMSLLRFLADKGGIKESRGELKARDLDKHFIPGFGKLVRPTGMSLDAAREAAVGAGYISDPGEATGGPSQSTIDDLLDAIDAEVSGSPVYAEEDRAEADAMRQEREFKTELDRINEDIDIALAEADMTRNDWSKGDLEAITQMVGEGLDPGDAFERISIQREGERPSDGAAIAAKQHDDSDIPWYDEAADDVQQRPAQEARRRAQEGGPVGQEREGPADAASVEQAAPRAGAAGVEKTEAGQQRVLPGAEREGVGETARRKAAAPLKPKAPQKPADTGLFGDESQQTDLIDEVRKQERKAAAEPERPVLAKPDDLSLEFATRAHAGISMDPERRGRSEQQGYVDHINAVYDDLAPKAKTEAQKAVLREEIEAYREGYLSRLRGVLAAKSNTMSPMVTGGSKFPVARNRKRLDAEMRKIDDLVKWQGKAQSAIKRKLDAARTGKEVADAEWTELKARLNRNIEIAAAIDAGEMPGMDRPAFTTSIAERLKRLAASGETDLVERALAHIRERQAGMDKPFFTDRHSVWGLAETARSQAQQQEAVEEQDGGVIAEFDGATIMRNPAEDRVQIDFDGKPGEDVRAALRGEGWRWSPRNSAWQRKLTPNSEASAKRIVARFYEPKAEPEGPTRLASTAVEPAQPVFYSALLRAVEGMPQPKGSPQQWAAMTQKAPGVKREELEWTGVLDWLAEQTGSVTKDQVADFVRANQIQVQEVEKPDPENRELYEEEGYGELDTPPDQPRFSQYTLPGGANYRELLLTLPHTPRDQVKPSEAVIARHKAEWDRLVGEIRAARRELDQARLEMSPRYGGIVDRVNTLEREQDALHERMIEETVTESRGRLGGETFRTAHFDEPNVLAHVRFNEREDADGKRVLFIEEVQSDWHQKGRKHGYTKSPDRAPTLDDAKEFFGITDDAWAGMSNERRQSYLEEMLSDAPHVQAGRRQAVPDAPFKTTWPELAFKRILRYAVDNGVDSVAWTPGEVQAERYDLSKHVKAIDWARNKDGSFNLGIEVHGERLLPARHAKDANELAELVGKEMADKIANSPKKVGRIEGLDLKVGGAGMRSFYDAILPSTVNKLVKRWGGRVGTTEIGDHRRLYITKESDGFYVREEGGSRNDSHGRFPTREQAQAKIDEIDQPAHTAHNLPITDAMRDSVRQGLPLFRRESDRDPVKIDPAERRILERALAAVVRRVAGTSPRILFADAIPLSDALPAEDVRRLEKTGGRLRQTVGGFWKYERPTAESIIAVAMADPHFDPRGTAYHEAWHHVEQLVLSDKERDVLDAEMDRMRAFIEPVIGAETAATWPDHEVTAIAFQRYATMKEATGLSAAVRRVFAKIARVLKEVRALLTRRGHTRFEDIFDAALAGEFAGRGRRDAAGGPMASTSLDHYAKDGAQARQARMQKAFTLQPLDRAMRLPFSIFGGVDHLGNWKPGLYLSTKAERLITTAKFSDAGRFAWANPILHRARAGLVDRYGLSQPYVERERQRGLDERKIMAEVPEIMQMLKERSIGPDEAKVLHAVLTGETVSDADMAKLAEPIRNSIDQMGQEAVELGLLSAEAFERNRGAYLHRVYLKHEADEGGLVRWANQFMGRRRKKIIGEQFKGRGLWLEVPLDRLGITEQDLAGETAAKPRKGDKFRVLDKVDDGQATLEDIDPGKVAKTLDRAYVREGDAVPEKYAGYQERGVWEVRGEKKGKIVLWRDFTKQERARMGEITDARYTIAKTYMVMAHDLATGRFFRDIAKNADWSRSGEPLAGTWKDAAEYTRHWADEEIEWVRVPDTTIPKSQTKRYGALAGRYVRAEIWRDIHELETLQKNNTWRKLLTQWKLNKTARSPVVHMNNVMSNFVLMDLADVGMADLVSGIKSMATGDANFQEALDNGAFGSDMVSVEIRKNVLQPLLDEISRDMRAAESATIEGRIGIVGKVAEAIWSKAKMLDRKMVDLYQLEDQVFRMATYMRKRAQGAAPTEAAVEARDQFLNYDIRAPWVNAARRSALPFISYTYRAIPIVARTVMHHPWKLAKYMAIMYGLNAMAYALFPGDEDEERRSMREQEQGYTWVGAPRMLRLPYGDAYGNPVFLDVRRWIPAGDVFDMEQGNGAMAIPAWLQFGGPLMMAAELVLNKMSFTGKEIVNHDTDDIWDKGSKIFDWGWKSWMPSAAWVPGSWYWEKIGNAMTGARDWQGRPYSVGQAALSSVGVKVKPQDVQEAFKLRAMEFDRTERELKAEIRRYARDRARGLISDKTFDRQREKTIHKLRNLNRKRRKTFTGKD